MEFPRHGLRLLSGGNTPRPVSVTMDMDEWLDVLDGLLDARYVNDVFGHNYSSTVNIYHRRKAHRFQFLFDKLNKGLSQ